MHGNVWFTIQKYFFDEAGYLQKELLGGLGAFTAIAQISSEDTDAEERDKLVVAYSSAEEILQELKAAGVCK